MNLVQDYAKHKTRTLINHVQPKRPTSKHTARPPWVRWDMPWRASSTPKDDETHPSMPVAPLGQQSLPHIVLPLQVITPESIDGNAIVHHLIDSNLTSFGSTRKKNPTMLTWQIGSCTQTNCSIYSPLFLHSLPPLRQLLWPLLQNSTTCKTYYRTPLLARHITDLVFVCWCVHHLLARDTHLIVLSTPWWLPKGSNCPLTRNLLIILQIIKVTKLSWVAYIPQYYLFGRWQTCASEWRSRKPMLGHLTLCLPWNSGLQSTKPKCTYQPSNHPRLSSSSSSYPAIYQE